MINYEDQERLQALAILLRGSQTSSPPDVSQRTRDELGRFAPEEEESESYSPRAVKIRKVEGTYGTYKILPRMSLNDKLFLASVTAIIYVIIRFV